MYSLTVGPISMKAVLIMLGLLLLQPAWAEWAQYWESEGGRDIYFFDPATLRKTANGRRVWFMSSHDSPKTHLGITFRSSRELIEYDCAGERSRLLQQELFSGLRLEGESVYSPTSDKPGPWSFIAPGTFSEARFTAVCRMPLK
jgi:hypothetical protein